MSRSEPIGSSTLSTVARLCESGRPLEALQHIAEGLRDGPGEDPAYRLAALCRELEDHPGLAAPLGNELRALLKRARISRALTESGVPTTRGFFGELVARMSQRFFPEPEDPSDLRTLVRTVFPRPADHLWVRAIPLRTWTRFLDALGITADSVPGVDEELASAIRILAHHVGSLGLQPEITRRLPHLEEPDSPFLALSERVLVYIRSFENGESGDEEPLLLEALETVALCRAQVERLRAEKGIYGTSLRLTGLSFRLLRLLDRLELLLHLTEPVERDFQGSAVALFRELVSAENTRDHLLPHIRESADLLAYQVVEHAAKKGSKYITSGRSDYFRFFLSSLGGGLVVAIFSLFKVVMGGWNVPLGIEAFLYGVNYSLCFVLIYLTGATLATKQPALTANTIAQALGDPDERHLVELENLVVRIWRSQFVSFVGNLAMALPVAFLLSEVFFRLSGSMVADSGKATEMLGGLHPWQSGTVLYAAAAGVFLFAAGLVSGWVDNRNLYARIPSRVAHHRLLIRLMGPGRAAGLAGFLDRNLGILAGNVFLGFALGSLGTVGEILGLPLDIRHIAFASAEFGTALEVLHFQVVWPVLWPIALGIVLIGLVNFVVSFGLSLVTALESRRITWNETRVLARHLGYRFMARPLDWFFPPGGRGTGA
jgi:site-specific recombinase